MGLWQKLTRFLRPRSQPVEIDLENEVDWLQGRLAPERAAVIQLQKSLADARVLLAEAQRAIGVLSEAQTGGDCEFVCPSGERAWATSRVVRCQQDVYYHVDRDGNVSEIPRTLAHRILAVGLWVQKETDCYAAK